jgi:hypothetical protein
MERRPRADDLPAKLIKELCAVFYFDAQRETYPRGHITKLTT